MASRIRAYIRQNHLSLLCLFLILGGGTAYAVDKVGSKDIKRGAVKSKHVADGSLLAQDFASGQLPAGSPGAPGTAGQGGTAPAGAVEFFNLAVCPSGWSELTTARGRYLVGRPSGGTLGGTAGTALSNVENRAVGLHSHGVTDPGHFHTTTINRGQTDSNASAVDRVTGDFGDLEMFSTSASTTGITINNAGSVAGTNAPYIQLLVCQKS